VIVKTCSIECEKKKQTTKQTMPYMNRGDSVAIVDATVKNRWRWEWLQDTDTQKHTIGDWCEKIDRAGLAFCRICNLELKYGSNGRKSLMIHSNNPDRMDTAGD
jgi:hypothetical protein